MYKILPYLAISTLCACSSGTNNVELNNNVNTNSIYAIESESNVALENMPLESVKATPQVSYVNQVNSNYPNSYQGSTQNQSSNQVKPYTNAQVSAQTYALPVTNQANRSYGANGLASNGTYGTNGTSVVSGTNGTTSAYVSRVPQTNAVVSDSNVTIAQNIQNGQSPRPKAVAISAKSEQTDGQDIVYKRYRNNIFSVIAPSSFEITSAEGMSIPAHLTLSDFATGSILTVSVSKYQRSMRETCSLVASNLVDDKRNIKKGPVIENGTCIVIAHENNKDAGIFMRVYEDNQTFYSIHVEGQISKILPIIKNIRGDSRMNALISSLNLR